MNHVLGGSHIAKGPGYLEDISPLAHFYRATLCAVIVCPSVRPPVCHKPVFCQNR